MATKNDITVKRIKQKIPYYSSKAENATARFAFYHQGERICHACVERPSPKLYTPVIN